jgi:hypothetical protein
MGKAIALALFTQLAIEVNCFSQPFMNKQIGIGTGVYFNALKSELISPYTHKGSSVPIQLFFRSGKEVSRHHVQLQYYDLTLTSSSNGLSTTAVGGYLQYAYQRKIRHVCNTIIIYGGPLISVNASSRNNLLNNRPIGNNKSGQLITSLNPSLLAELQIRGNLLTIQLWSPMFTLLYQQGYALGPVESSWISLNKFGGIDSRISYDNCLSDRWNARFDYQFQFYRLTRYETLVSLSNQFLVSLVYKIK